MEPNKQIDIETLMATWALSKRAVNRWLYDHDPLAPLNDWIEMPVWADALPYERRSRLTGQFLKNIAAAKELRTKPNPGSVASMIWFLAATASELRGVHVPIPEPLMAWLSRFGAGEFVPPKITNPELGRQLTGDSLAEHVGFFNNRCLCPDDFRENPKFIENWVNAAHANRTAA